MNVHTPSLLAGFGIAALVAVTTGQQIIGSPAVEVRVLETVTPGRLDPGEAVRLIEGSPFTVPVGKRLVITALGHNSLGGGVRVGLSVDGLREISVWFRDDQTAGFTELTGTELPAPIVAESGSTVEVLGVPPETYSHPDDGRAWGYLTDN